MLNLAGTLTLNKNYVPVPNKTKHRLLQQLIDVSKIAKHIPNMNLLEWFYFRIWVCIWLS